MLELIVLGSVPGTDFYVTFGQAAIALLVVFLYITHLRKLKQALSDRQNEIEESTP